MTGVYNTVEPAVIDETMLRNAVFSQGPRGTAGNYAKKEGIPFITVTCLRLDYQNILKIDNLRAFKNLVKLQMDNNIIEKIEGLDDLIHLRWLDLSFNNIERIEGLDKLVNIEDLTFYNNRIRRIENMDKLAKLQILSIGNNNLDELEDLLYLRRFPLLKSICLRGNPICEQPQYNSFLLAFLPQIVYVDYKLTKEDAKEEAYEKHQLRVDQLSAQEQAEKEQQAIEEERQQVETLHQRAFVSGLDSDTIFDTLYKEDPEGRELLAIPELLHCIEQYPFRGLQINDDKCLNHFFSPLDS
ncbi:Dynein regulatory complex subunit 3 [Fasciola hepatica]|uniref:Dynein regulatory complex subunit 3 n=1 Tax=Fasciola hepatica TaxID=6192 RepID=A0A2H1CPA1_FASHE|nr:Dynein regulatory complex subunit 3 [Fasciola hepatica]